MKKTSTWLAACLLLTLQSLAQTESAATKPAMADVLRSNGKIYVVVGVLLVILAGIVLYLISIDRKVTSLEKQPDRTPTKV